MAQDNLNKLIEVIRSALQRDRDLREKYKIGEKFRFIRDRIQALLSTIEETVQVKQAAAQTKNEDTRDEVVVYVYLYNAQGDNLKSWEKMLNPKVFYEYSINRPIYTEKSHVEAFIRGRPNKNQHAYLAVSIKSHDIIKNAEAEASKDIFGNPLIKIKEGSLRFNKLISLTHCERTFHLNEVGELI